MVVQELKLREREEQQRIREQMREEEKVRREQERAIQEAQKEEDMRRQAREAVQKQMEEAIQELKAKLEKAVGKLYEADRALRDARPDDRIVMEELILTLTAA